VQTAADQYVPAPVAFRANAQYPAPAATLGRRRVARLRRRRIARAVRDRYLHGDLHCHLAERRGRPMAQQYIFQMQGLTKAFPGATKKTFENIWLSFYPDAKIGVVGVNGSGKSTLLKIMATWSRNPSWTRR
jgi:ABC-type molybdenum transport system ATPase subunit/photorepair protein PhrA